MGNTEAPRLTLADITVGDSLPVLRQEVSATTVILGALASRDWRPMHHDRDFARERNGMGTEEAYMRRFLKLEAIAARRPHRLQE